MMVLIKPIKCRCCSCSCFFTTSIYMVLSFSSTSVSQSVRPMQSVILRNWLFYSTPFLIRNCKNKQHKDNYLCPFVMKKKLKTTKYLTKLMNVNIKLWLCFKWVERRKFFCNFTRQLQMRKKLAGEILTALGKIVLIFCM